MNAFQEVMREGNYDYVFKGYNFWQVPLSNSLTISVLKRLGIKVPDELQLQGQAPAKTATPGRKQ